MISGINLEKRQLQPNILLVEDNKDLVMNIKLSLTYNGYNVQTTFNGIEALEALAALPTPPDLIISDIMMPKMNGYDFFQKVSDNPEWKLIPFIFISAKSSPEDIRFGKKLGVDDYITKPFVEEDLLASVEGKIQRGRENRKLSKQIEEKLLSNFKTELKRTLSKDKIVQTSFLLIMFWDEDWGPRLRSSYPREKEISFPLSDIGIQLFQTAASIYGQRSYYAAEGVLLRIANIDMDGYLFFDTIDDGRVRGGKRQFMLGYLSAKINYLESIRIKEILEDLAHKIKNNDDWIIKYYWKRITEILLTSPMK